MPAYLTPEARDGARRRRRALRLRPLSRPRAGARRTRRGMPPTIARRARAPRRRCATPREGARVARGLGRRSRRVRHGGGGLRGDRERRRRPGARSTSRSCRASPRCWRSRRGSARRSATISARISLSDNLKPWELIERRLDAAAGGGLRHRALQSDLARAALAARQGLRRCCAASAGRDAGDFRPRGRPAGRDA